MKSTTETLSPTRIKLTIEVPFEEFKPSLDAAYKTIGSQITIPGFRKGKVPAAIVDQRVGAPRSSTRPSTPHCPAGTARPCRTPRSSR